MSSETGKLRRRKSAGGRPIRSYSPVTPFLVLPFRRASASAVRGLLKNVLTEFFFLQQREKFGLAKIPVISADHALDDKIPFTPEKVSVYMDFVPFFLRPLSMLIRRLGAKKAAPACADFVRMIAGLYRLAGSVYRVCMSTTRRPDYKRGGLFRLIHGFDPHLLCVPSLHVSIVTACYVYFRELLSRKDFEEEFSEEERKSYLEELYGGASAITESVLLVKQHSVNCIAAALYMMTAAGSGNRLTPDDAVRFIGGLFADAPEILPSDRAEIAEYIQSLYERLLLESSGCDDWREPLFRWFQTYAAETGQSPARP